MIHVAGAQIYQVEEEYTPSKAIILVVDGQPTAAARFYLTANVELDPSAHPTETASLLVTPE
jgi:hypothetical protein